MNKNNKTAILMATYNGEKYIREQIDSILEQTCINWELYIRDDGSKDETVSIINEYIAKDSRIHLINPEPSKHGACINFYCLLSYAKQFLCEYKFFFLSDQDDTWDNRKIEDCIELIEQYRSQNLAILTYSDLRLMSEDGVPTSVCMSDIQDIDLVNPADIYFNQIYVWGNTCGFSRELLEMVTIPDDVYNELSHDHYLAFYAAAFGKVIYINRPLVNYRRHEGNVSGLPQKYSIKHAIKKLYRGLDSIISKHNTNYNNVMFFARYAPFENELIADLKECFQKGGVTSLRIIRKYRIKAGANFWNKNANIFILLFKLYTLKY